MNPDIKTLQPLTYGNILIVGAKSSNFGQEIITNPRVIIWNSQEEHWTDKDLPQNVRAIFITKWIGHSTFHKIHDEAKKKHITIFNPEGTGIITRQVKELLNMNTPTTVETESTTEKKPVKQWNQKLHVLVRYIDFKKKNVDNANALMNHARELGIETTVGSLAVFVANQRKKLTPLATQQKTPTSHVRSKSTSMDVSVQILDSVVKELQDMRDYLVAVTKENQILKTRIEKFKKFLSDE